MALFEISPCPGDGEDHRATRRGRREGSLRFIAYLHIFAESPRRFIKFNVFIRVGTVAAPRTLRRHFIPLNFCDKDFSPSLAAGYSRERALAPHVERIGSTLSETRTSRSLPREEK